MQGKVYEIPLDIVNGALTSQIRALVTEDMGTNTFRFKVVKDKHVPYDFTGTTVRMMVKTPSGARIQQECTIENAVGGTVSLTLKQSLLLEHGSYIAELQIFDAITQSIRLTTPTFTYHVRQSLQNSESIVATDEYTILQEALADLAGINIVVANKADKSDVGDLEVLETEEKANLVQAINEVKSQSNEHATQKVTDLVGVHGLKVADYKDISLTMLNGWIFRGNKFITKIGNLVTMMFTISMGVKDKGTVIFEGLPSELHPVGSLAVLFEATCSSNQVTSSNQLFEITYDGKLKVLEKLTDTYQYNILVSYIARW